MAVDVRVAVVAEVRAGTVAGEDLAADVRVAAEADPVVDVRVVVDVQLVGVVVDHAAMNGTTGVIANPQRSCY